MSKGRARLALLVASLAVFRLAAEGSGSAGIEGAPEGVRPTAGGSARATLSVGFLYGFQTGPIGSPSPYSYPPGIGVRVEYAPPRVLFGWWPFLAADLRWHAAVSLEPEYFAQTRFLLPGIHLGLQRGIAYFEDGRAFDLAIRLGYIHYVREHVFMETVYRGSRPALSLEGTLRARGPGPLRAFFGPYVDLILDAHPYLVPGVVAGLDYRRELGGRER